jgi:hypothetical protein
MDKVVEEVNKKNGWHVGIHVDAASGGFIAPFTRPDLKWDFQLKNVSSSPPPSFLKFEPSEHIRTPSFTASYKSLVYPLHQPSSSWSASRILDLPLPSDSFTLTPAMDNYQTALQKGLP